MNGITILIWITIIIVGIIAIILVKLHYNGDELEKEESILFSTDNCISELISKRKEKTKINDNNTLNNTNNSLSKKTNDKSDLFRKSDEIKKPDDEYITPEVKKNNLENFEYESQNRILVNYDNKIKKFQEPIKQSQMDIMTQINKNKDTELKDLFTIDELIKESKRKDSEREKESKTISKKPENDKELDEIKKSIESKNKSEKPLVDSETTEKKEETIGELIKNTTTKTTAGEIKSHKTQSTINTPINTETKDTSENIDNIVQQEITKPVRKIPKVEDYTKETSINKPNTFEENNEQMDLDYRKDLDKITNKIKESKLYQEFKEKVTPEIEDMPEEDSMFIKNVQEYDEPIVNETHTEYENIHGSPKLGEDETLRQKNTKNMFNNNTSSTTLTKPTPASKSKDSLTIKLNNNDITIKKGDEVIFNHKGETYSSQIYAIKGNDITVKYRRKKITIKPNDIKKIY